MFNFQKAPIKVHVRKIVLVFLLNVLVFSLYK